MNLMDANCLEQVMGLMCQAIACRATSVTGTNAEALALLDEALTLVPDFIPAHMQRADLLEQDGALPAALAAYEACLAIAPTFEDARAARERVLLRQVAQGEAAADSSDNHFMLAGALHALRRSESALVHARAALAAAPAHFAARVLCADILLQLNRHEEALACYAGVEASGDAQWLVSFNQADILRQMGCFTQALDLLNELVRQCPSFAEAQVARAHLLLQQADFEAGWLAHEHRHAIVGLAGHCPCPTWPAWQVAQNIDGLRVLLWAEQGWGDTLQFARYIGVVASRAAAVTVVAPAPMLGLLAPAFPICQFVAQVHELPPHDVQAPLMSLPLLLGLPDPAQAPAVPYLQADTARMQQWQARLEVAMPRRRPRVGLVWAGRQYAQINHTRDIALSQFHPLMALDIDLVALQPALSDEDAITAARLEGGPGRLHHFALNDWAETAALVAQLDAVISVDTAVAHLAGALGKRGWLLLRFEGEWRWGLQPRQSAWYPSLQLLRQSRRGHWDESVAEVAQQLQAWLSSAD